MDPSCVLGVARGSPAVWAAPGAPLGRDCWAPVLGLTGARTVLSLWGALDRPSRSLPPSPVSFGPWGAGFGEGDLSRPVPGRAMPGPPSPC